jgi:predicted histidine transporter YuiF (NhaC family)
MLAYGVVLVLAITLVRTHHLPSAVTTGIAFTPMIPLVWLLTIVMDRFRALDELERRITSEALVFGFGCTALTTLTYGFLQIFAQAPAVDWIWVWPVQAVFWLVGAAVARRRYSE